jgi:hypothetical protein
MSPRRTPDALPRSPGGGVGSGRAAARRLRRRVATGLGLVGVLVMLGACTEPELADEEDETTEETAASAPSATAAPETELLREQFGLLEASVARAREHLRAAAAASDLTAAETAGADALAQLLADGTLAGGSPDEGDPPAVLPAESVVRGDQRTYPDALTPALSAARQAGGTLGDQVVGVLRDPLAGDLATWERDPVGMIAQAEAVADPDRALEELDAAVLDLEGDALRALAWALLVTEADDLEHAQAYGERGAVHLDLILEAMAQVIEPAQPEGAIEPEDDP